MKPPLTPVLVAAIEQFKDQATNRLLIAALEEDEDSGTTQKDVNPLNAEVILFMTVY